MDSRRTVHGQSCSINLRGHYRAKNSPQTACGLFPYFFTCDALSDVPASTTFLLETKFGNTRFVSWVGRQRRTIRREAKRPCTQFGG